TEGAFDGGMGKSARLVIDGVDVIVAIVPNQVTHPWVFRVHGINPEEYKLVVVKGSNHFRAGFQGMSKAIVTADSPGLTTMKIDVFPRSRSPRPIWPLDQETTYERLAT